MGMKQGRFSNAQIVWILRETDQDSVAVVASTPIWREGQQLNE
jgi:hypothetical protein